MFLLFYICAVLHAAHFRSECEFSHKLFTSMCECVSFWAFYAIDDVFAVGLCACRAAVLLFNFSFMKTHKSCAYCVRHSLALCVVCVFSFRIYSCECSSQHRARAHRKASMNRLQRLDKMKINFQVWNRHELFLWLLFSHGANIFASGKKKIPLYYLNFAWNPLERIA